MYENKVLCSKCGGICCKNFPGSYFPDDFKDGNGYSLKKLLKLIKEGKLSVDWVADDWDEMEKKYFIRPKVKNEIKNLFSKVGGSENDCIFLTEKGCGLKIEERPHNCRYLEPKEKGNCISHDGSKKQAICEWEKYNYLFEFLKLFWENENA